MKTMETYSGSILLRSNCSHRFSFNPSENSLNLSGCDSIDVVVVENLDIRCLRDVAAFGKTLREFLVLAEDRILVPNNFLSQSNIKDLVRNIKTRPNPLRVLSYTK